MPLRFLAALIIFALCVPAEAQQPKQVPRIGFLSVVRAADPPYDSFRRGLRDLGYVKKGIKCAKCGSSRVVPIKEGINMAEKAKSEGRDR